MFGRFGQVVGFFLLWGGLNIVICRWLLRGVLDAPIAVIWAVCAVNGLVALFADVLKYERGDQPPIGTMAVGDVTGDAPNEISFQQTDA